MSLPTQAPSQHSPHLLGLPLEAVADILDYVLLESHHITFNDGRCIVDHDEWPIDFLYTCRFLYGAGVDAIRRAFAEHSTLVFVKCLPPSSKFRYSEKLMKHLNKQQRMMHLFTHSYMPFFTKVEIVGGLDRHQKPDIALEDLRLLTIGPIPIQAPSHHLHRPMDVANMNDRDLSAWVNKRWEEPHVLQASVRRYEDAKKFAVVAKLVWFDGKDKQGKLSWVFTWDPDTKRVLDKERR